MKSAGILGVDGKLRPISEIKSQMGLKRDIIDLVLNLAAPDDDCMLSDFLHAFQYVFYKHAQFNEGVSGDVEQAAEDFLEREYGSSSMEFPLGLSCFKAGAQYQASQQTGGNSNKIPLTDEQYCNIDDYYPTTVFEYPNEVGKTRWIEFAIAERKRAMQIAKGFMQKYDKDYRDKKAAGSNLAFVKQEMSEACRYIMNSISGLSSLSTETVDIAVASLYKQAAQPQDKWVRLKDVRDIIIDSEVNISDETLDWIDARLINEANKS